MSGTVVVTGASTGIGEATATHLAGLGFDVVAGVRTHEDALKLEAVHDRVTAVRLDVTVAETIAALRERIDGDSGRGTAAGLVNNAGIAVTAPMEVIPIDEFRRQLEVNVVGQAAVTQALLPALRRGKGTVVNISSLGGRLALPIAGPYAASKFALEGMSDSLRREVRHLGVKVVVVEPGGIKTPIWAKGLDGIEEQKAAFGAEAMDLYGGLVNAVERESRKIATETGLPPSAVAEVVGTALTAKRPRTRYLVGRDAKLRAGLAGVLPDRVFDALLARALR